MVDVLKIGPLGILKKKEKKRKKENQAGEWLRGNSHVSYPSLWF